MSDTTGADPTRTDAAGGGTPNESDLPAMQGLGESTDDPSDPSEPRQPPAGDDVADIAGTDDEGPSDPMPDMAGTS